MGKFRRVAREFFKILGFPTAFLKITEDDFLKGKTMSDAKRDYSENVKRRKEDALLDGDLTKTIQEAYNRRKRFGDNWESVDINEVVAEIAPNGKIGIRDGKIFFTNKEETMRVVADVSGYLRVERLPETTNGSYLDRHGKDVHNYTDERGKQHGRTKSDFNRVTHYRIKKREEME